MSTRTAAGRLTAALVALVIAAPFFQVQAAEEVCPGVSDAGDWTVARVKGLAGPVTDHAADPLRLYATDGDTLVVSGDRGCRWLESFSLPQTASSGYPSATTADIVAVEVMHASGDQTRVGLRVAETVGGQTRPHMIVGVFPSVSRDPRGQTGQWHAADEGLPPLGYPEFLATSQATPAIAYLGIDIGGGTVDALYASNDGGDSWTLRSDLAGLSGSQGIVDMDADPTAPEQLWAWGPGGVKHSTDGGRTFTPVDDFAGEAVGPMDVFRVRGSPARLMAHRPNKRDFLMSIDGGASWHRIGSPAVVDSITHGATSNEVVMIAGGRVWSYHAPSFSWLDLKAPASTIADVTALETGIYVARSGDRLFIYDGPTGGDYAVEIGETFIDIPLLDTPDAPPAGTPQISPARHKVVLDIGEKRTVRYELTMPERLVPLDVVFLLDTTSSMKRFTAGLAVAYADIVNGLAERGIDARFGIAEHRAYPDFFPPREDEPNFVYRNRLQVGASGDALGDVLRTLQNAGGGAYDAQLGALYQLATGAGQDLAPKGSPLGHDVPPGQQMNFRAKALRVVILGTDEPFGTPSSGGQGDGEPGGLGATAPEIPSFEEVQQALNTIDAHQIGISVGPSARADLQRMAEGTGALAPRSGVDCDGDGSIDIAPDAALVCPMTRATLSEAGSLAPAIVNLVEAVRTRSAVSLEARDEAGVIARIDPAVHPGVVLQTTNRLTFDVTYSCPPLEAGSRARVELDAVSASEVLDEAQVTVICTERPDFARPIPAALIPAALAVPAAPPPPGIPELASQVNSQAQFHAQAAVANQEQQQPQVAMVHSFHAEEEARLAESHEMAAFRPRPKPAEPAYAVGATALLMGAAFLVVSRAQLRTARARVRR